MRQLSLRTRRIAAAAFGVLAAALGQVVSAGRERQHHRAEGDGEHAEGGRRDAPGPQAELSHAGTSSRN